MAFCNLVFVSPPDWPSPENGDGEVRGVGELAEDEDELPSLLLLDPPPKKPPSILPEDESNDGLR